MKRPLILTVGLAALVAAGALAAVLLWLIPGRTSAAQLPAGTLFRPTMAGSSKRAGTSIASHARSVTASTWRDRRTGSSGAPMD